MSKLTMLAAGAAGYVLGTRAGRERYDQIAATAGKVWRDPRVQKGKEQATDAAKQAADSAKQTVQDKVSSDENGTSSTDSSTTSPSTASPSSASPSVTGAGAGAPSTDAIPEAGITPGDVAKPAFPTDPSQPAPGGPSQGAVR